MLAEKERKLREFVGREVTYCVSHLISEMGKNEAYMDELMENGAFCQFDDDGEVENEVFEHWLVTGWLKNKLEEHGEVTFNFHGLEIWGRTTTGQAIILDYVIEKIYDDIFGE